MLPRVHRIPKKTFPLLKKNKSFEGEVFGIRATKSSEQKKCFVCIISKKTEKSAVKRNKMRRRVYSILLNENFDFKDYTYIQIFPKKTAFQKNYINLKDDIISLIKKI